MYLTIVAKAAFGNVDPEQVKNCTLYVIREGNIIFYVGKSVDPLERFQQHMGKSQRFRPWPSHVGEFILHNQAFSGTWSYDLLVPEECKIYTDMLKRDFGFIEHSPFPEKHPDAILSLTLAEADLIQYLRPCCNGTNNPNPTPVPEKYQWVVEVPSIIYPAGWELTPDPEHSTQIVVSLALQPTLKLAQWEKILRLIAECQNNPTIQIEQNRLRITFAYDTLDDGPTGIAAQREYIKQKFEEKTEWIQSIDIT